MMSLGSRLAGGVLLMAAAGVAPAAAQLLAVSVHLGANQVLDTGRATQGGIELAFPPRLLGIAPTVGGAVSDDGSAYAYVGFRRDFSLGGRLSVTPFTGVGAYHRGEGPNLGGSAQFRSGLEWSLLLNGRGRLSLAFYHLSNAGLQRPNPGTESLVLAYSFLNGER